MTRESHHSTSDVVTVFARQGISIATIARAMAIPAERVEGMCRRAQEDDELQMMPPATPDDPRSALLVELTNLRAQLDDAQEQIRNLMGAREIGIATYVGVAGMTRSEATVVAAIVKKGRVHKSSIYHALYGGEEVGPEPKIVDVMVCKVRKKLRSLGIEIDTVWGAGYKMSPDMIEKLRSFANVETLATIAVPRVASPSLQASLSEMVA